MAIELAAMRDALEELTDVELRALKVATNEAPQNPHGLPAWIEGACDWEINRRLGRHYELLPPQATIDPSEDAVSIQATHAIRASFASSDLAPAVLKFLDVLLRLLAGD